MLFNYSVDLLISSRLPFDSDSFRFCVIDLDILLPYRYLLTKNLRVYRAPNVRPACGASHMGGAWERMIRSPRRKPHGRSVGKDDQVRASDLKRGCPQKSNIRRPRLKFGQIYLIISENTPYIFLGQMPF